MRNWISLDSRLWVSSILNVIAVGCGLISILATRSVQGQSPIMYGMFLFMQITYAEAGYRNKLWGQFWGMAASAVITSVILSLIFAWG